MGCLPLRLMYWIIGRARSQKRCEAGNKPNIITTSSIVAMRGCKLALSIGNKCHWAHYPTPLTVGGATEGDALGQKNKCAPVLAANHLSVVIVSRLKRSLGDLHNIVHSVLGSCGKV